MPCRLGLQLKIMGVKFSYMSQDSTRSSLTRQELIDVAGWRLLFVAQAAIKARKYCPRHLQNNWKAYLNRIFKKTSCFCSAVSRSGAAACFGHRSSTVSPQRETQDETWDVAVTLSLQRWFLVFVCVHVCFCPPCVFTCPWKAQILPACV